MCQLIYLFREVITKLKKNYMKYHSGEKEILTLETWFSK